MAEVPPFSMDFQPDEDDFNISELLSLPSEEVPVNQSSMLQNPGPDSSLQSQNIQQTAMRGLDGASSSCINQNGPNWPQTPSSDQQWTNQLPMSNQVPGMLPQPPMSQCSQQFPYQVSITPYPYDPQSSTMLPESSQTLRHQNSFIHQPQQGYVYMTPNATTSQHGGFNPPAPRSPQFPPHNLQVSGDHNQGQVDQASVIPHIENMQQESLMPLNFDRSTRHQNSFIHQPQQGYVYMTPNVTTSQHGGFNQPTPRIQYIPNQGQVDQASVIPNIDNMQQENLVPRNSGKSTRSQMDNLQVQGLQNQTSRPNASNPCPDSSLQSQNRGLNTQQVQRARDPFWNHVEEKDDGSMICSFCERRWANKIPISRIKWHLSGEEGHGVAICPSVDKEVQEEALEAMRSGNKRHKSTTSSINEVARMGGDIGRVQREDQVVEARVGDEWISSHEVARNNIVSMTGMRAQEDRVFEGALESRLVTEPVDRALEQSNLAGTAGRTQLGVQGTKEGAGEERIQSHSQAENAMEDTIEGSFRHDAFQTIHRTEQVQHLERRSSCERQSINQADEPRGDSSQPLDPLCLDYGRYYDQQPFAPSVSNDVIMNDVQNMVRERTKLVEEHDVVNAGRLVQPGTGAGSSKSLKCNKTKGVPFPTSSNKPVGKTFEENTKEIWSLLMDDEVSTIGIYGMGGVGKTTLLQHIHNELLERQYDVWWVTVSQDFSINRLQNLIAKRLELDLSSEDDDLHRAAKLSEELRKKQKWILILDDLWNSFELHDVGIHSSFKGCKLILTTRSQTVCDQIDCQHKIKLKPLLEGESWTLFKENLRRHIALSDEVKGIARDVARECAGLPLGIITVAGSLRGVDDPHQWRNTLKKLKDSGTGDMKVFKLLRFSYDRLDDSALQQCLLYCALFPEDHMIEKEELIGYLIDEGIIKGMGRRQDAFDEGHTMLNRLQYVCLLENATIYGDSSVKMHDLIRDMAIQIMQEKSQVIVKAGAQLEELPDAEEWTENLTRVSLMKNKIRKIPSSYSPKCPNLSTLFLCQNRLECIADSFFKQLHGLKVLDLSQTDIEKLPESVSDLVSLTALLLLYCEQLRYVPSLEKLRALKSLDLYGTYLEKMPQGMECLSNLRYVRINACGEKKFPSGILPKLSHLQVFAEFPTECYTVEGMEVGCLGKLETLKCHFKGLSDFMEYLTSRDGIQSLSTYLISVGTFKGDYCGEIDDMLSKIVKLGNLSFNRDRDFQVKLLNDIQGLYCESIDARSLCDVLSFENATELEHIYIDHCDSMESFASSSWFCSATLPLPSHNGMFSRLKEFHCYKCANMEKLFPLELLPYLVNLEYIRVSYCEKMEEIIGTTDEENSTSNPITELTLPKLKNLDLFELPELKGICSVKLICNSLEEIHILSCEKLKRISISLPLLENGQPSPHPSLKNITARPEEWWETVVEWEPPNAKEILRPIVHFWIW